MTQVSIQQAQSQLKELLAAAQRGEEVVIDDDNHASVRLVPVERPRGTPRFGSAKGKIRMADDFDQTSDF